MTMLSTHLSETLNAFIGFGTVVVQIVSVCATYLEIGPTTDVQKSFGDLQKETAIAMGQQILDVLTPTLGPAETAVPGDVTCYILHPQDYLARSA